MAGRYITWSGDVLVRYRDLASLVYSDGPADSAYIYFGEAWVDAQLARYFATPFSSNNVTAKDLAVDAVFLRAVGPQDSARAKQIRERMEQSVADLIAGRMQMVTDSGDLLSTAGEPVYSTTEDYHPTFGVGDPLDFRVDCGQIEDEENART